MVWIWAENNVTNTGMFLLCLQRANAFSPSHPPARMLVEWCNKELGGTHPGQLTLTDPRYIPYCRTSCSAYKAKRRRRKGGTFRVMEFLFPSNRYAWWSPAALVMAEHQPAMGSAEWIPWFASLVCAAFALLIKLFISTHEFSLSPFLFSPPRPPGGVSEQLSRA